MWMHITPTAALCANEVFPSADSTCDELVLAASWHWRPGRAVQWTIQRGPLIAYNRDLSILRYAISDQDSHAESQLRTQTKSRLLAACALTL